MTIQKDWTLPDDPNELKWYDEMPTQPGWYWYRQNSISAAQILLLCGRSWHTMFDNGPMDKKLLTGEWYGPLPAPPASTETPT